MPSHSGRKLRLILCQQVENASFPKTVLSGTRLTTITIVVTMREPRLKNVLVKLLKFGISFAILGYLFYRTQQEDEFATIMAAPKNWGWIAFGIGAGLTACMFGFIRWFILVRALQVPISFIDAVRLGFLGHLFNLMSVGVLGGDALKSVFVAKQAGNKKTEAVLSVFADRLIGLTTMFSVAAVAFWCIDFERFDATNPTELNAIKWICKSVTIISAFAIGSFILFYTIPNLTRLPIFLRMEKLKWVGGFIAKALGAVSAYREKPSAIASAFVLSLGINLMFASAIFGVAAGLSSSHPTYPQHFVIAPIAMVANAVPLPGGLGGLEFALDYLYRGFSAAELPTEHGFVVALGFRMILLSVALIGVFVYLSRRKEIDSLSEKATSESMSLPEQISSAQLTYQPASSE